jgi:hypothetical protein
MALAARTSMTSARITGWGATLLAAGALAAAIFAPANLQLPGAVALALMSIACMTLACTGRWPSVLALIADAAALALGSLARDPSLPVWSIPQSWGDLLHLSGPGFVAFLLLQSLALLVSVITACTRAAHSGLDMAQLVITSPGLLAFLAIDLVVALPVVMLTVAQITQLGAFCVYLPSSASC